MIFNLNSNGLTDNRETLQYRISFQKLILKLKFHQNSSICTFNFSSTIILKFCTGHGSITAMLCAKFQNDWATEKYVMNKEDCMAKLPVETWKKQRCGTLRITFTLYGSTIEPSHKSHNASTIPQCTILQQKSAHVSQKFQRDRVLPMMTLLFLLIWNTLYK